MSAAEPGALPLILEPRGPAEAGALAGRVAEQRAELLRLLHAHGAVLFRGFSAGTEGDLHQVARALDGELLSYREGDSPRTRVADGVYTSTEYPPPLTIEQHNEMSYARRWPRRLFFLCQRPATQGGETPLARSARIYRRIPEETRALFEQRGLRYVQNLHGGSGLGRSWQDTFETRDREAVEAYCRDADIQLRWKPDGGLHIERVRQAAATHPETGERVWFNQADHWHVSALDRRTRQSLARLMPEADFPKNCYFGDGGPIPEEALGRVREAVRAETVTFPWREGDLLIADNLLVSHGRRPFTGPRRVLVAMT